MGVGAGLVLVVAIVVSSIGDEQETPVTKTVQEQEWVARWNASSQTLRSAQCSQWNSDRQTYLEIGVASQGYPREVVGRLMDYYC